MCGRYGLFTTPEELSRIFRLPPEEVRRIFERRPRYNVAPTDRVAAVRSRRDGEAREPVLLHWGLIPSWADDPRMGARMINARAETLAQKPSFRDAFRTRRCLVLADGFYEWQPRGKRKQPFFVRMKDRQPFGFAGLWERWEDQRYGPIESCTIITTTPNELVRPLHNRMPAVIGPADHDRWLDPSVRDGQELRPLLQPLPSELMEAYPVSTLVNHTANDVPACVEPVELV